MTVGRTSNWIDPIPGTAFGLLAKIPGQIQSKIIQAPEIPVGLDTARNFAKVTVSGSYGAQDTAITLNAGHGAKLPSPPFNLVWWDVTAYADPSDDPNAEIIRVLQVTGDILNVIRGQEATNPSSKNTGSDIYRMIQAPTKLTISQIMSLVQPKFLKAIAWCNSGPTLSGWTKVPINQIYFDPSGIVNIASSRIIPTLPGFYQVTGQVYLAAAATCICGIYVNGVLMAFGSYVNTNPIGANVGGLVYLNGSSDYVELWASASATLNKYNAPQANYLTIVGPF